MTTPDPMQPPAQLAPDATVTPTPTNEQQDVRERLTEAIESAVPDHLYAWRERYTERAVDNVLSALAAPDEREALDLAPIRARAEAATEGPWSWHNTGEPYLSGARTRIVLAFRRMGMNGAQPAFRNTDGLLDDAGRANIYAYPDARFIAAAREDVPALLAEVDRLRAALAARPAPVVSGADVERSVRETVAAALYEMDPLPTAPTWDMLVADANAHAAYPRLEMAWRLQQADAALAAIATHGGLTDMLAAHHHIYDVDCSMDYGCDCGAIDDYDKLETGHADHLADVIRTWLRDDQ